MIKSFNIKVLEKCSEFNMIIQAILHLWKNLIQFITACMFLSIYIEMLGWI